MGQKFFASDSVSSILVATTSFLSALILSRKMSMLSARLSCAKLRGAKPKSITAIATPMVFFIRFILIAFLLLLWANDSPGCQNDLRGKAGEDPRAEAYSLGTLMRSGPSTTKHMSRFDSLLGIRIDFSDLRALYTHTSHESRLVEDKSINTLLQSCRRQVLAEARIEHYQARSYSQLPALAVVKILNGRIVHEEQHIAECLNARLESIRRGKRPIVRHALAVLS